MERVLGEGGGGEGREGEGRRERGGRVRRREMGGGREMIPCTRVTMM